MVYGSFYEIQRVAIIREASMEVGFLQPACLCIAAVGSYSSKQSLDTPAFVTGWTVAVVVENYIRVRAFSVDGCFEHPRR